MTDRDEPGGSVEERATAAAAAAATAAGGAGLKAPHRGSKRRGDCHQCDGEQQHKSARLIGVDVVEGVGAASGAGDLLGSAADFATSVTPPAAGPTTSSGALRTDHGGPLTFVIGGYNTNIIALHLIACTAFAGADPRAMNRVIVTVYFLRNTRIHNFQGDPDCMAYNPRTDQVHNDHPLHHVALHRAEQPYELHTHILVTATKLWDFVEKLLCRQMSGAKVKSYIVPELVARIRSLWSSGAARGNQKVVEFVDGCKAHFSACVDAEVLDREKDVVSKLAAARGNSAEEERVIYTAMKLLRRNSAVSYIETIAGFVGMKRLANMRLWKTNTIVHVLVETGSVKALSHFLQKYAWLDVNVQRSKDKCTPLHLACWKRTDKEEEARFADFRAAVISVLVANGASATLKNKYGESCERHPLVLEALAQNSICRDT